MTAQVIINGTAATYESGATIPVQADDVVQIAVIDDNGNVGAILDPADLDYEVNTPTDGDLQVTLDDGTVLVFAGMMALLGDGGTTDGLADANGVVAVASIEDVIPAPAAGEQQAAATDGGGSSDAFNQFNPDDTGGPSGFGSGAPGSGLTGGGEGGGDGEVTDPNLVLLLDPAALGGGPGGGAGPGGGPGGGGGGGPLSALFTDLDDTVDLSGGVSAFSPAFGVTFAEDGNITDGLDGNDDVTLADVGGINNLNDLAIAGTIPTNTFSAGEGDDVVTGGNDGDVIDGEAGDDTLDGGSRRDSLIGGAGNDDLDGGPGRDTLDGGIGQDTLQGGSDRDTLFGGPGDDSILGGPGNDLNIWNNGDGSDSVDGGSGTDTQRVIGADGAGDEFEIGDDAGDAVFERTNLGLFTLTLDDVEQLEVRGEDGDDTFTVNDLAGTDLTTVTFVGGDGDDLLDGTGTATRLVGFGRDDADTLSGGSASDRLEGGDGDDVLNGNGGADSLFGQSGNDTIFGGNGEDIVNGGAGDDTIDIGADNRNNERVIISDRADGIDTIINFDNIGGSATSDTLDLDALFDDLELDLGLGAGGLDTAARTARVSVVQDGADSNVFIDQSAAGNDSDLVQIADVVGTTAIVFQIGDGAADDIFVGA